MRWRRKWQPTPVFLPGESQGWGSLVGCRLWGRTESDTTEATQQQQQQCLYIPISQFILPHPPRLVSMFLPGLVIYGLIRLTRKDWKIDLDEKIFDKLIIAHQSKYTMVNNKIILKIYTSE